MIPLDLSPVGLLSRFSLFGFLSRFIPSRFFAHYRIRLKGPSSLALDESSRTDSIISVWKPTPHNLYLLGILSDPHTASCLAGQTWDTGESNLKYQTFPMELTIRDRVAIPEICFVFSGNERRPTWRILEPSQSDFSINSANSGFSLNSAHSGFSFNSAHSCFSLTSAQSGF